MSTLQFVNNTGIRRVPVDDSESLGDGGWRAQRRTPPSMRQSAGSRPYAYADMTNRISVIVVFVHAELRVRVR